MQLKLNWEVQQNEVDTPTKTGEVLARVNIKTSNVPFGHLWVGMTVLTDAQQQLLNKPFFSLMFNQFVLATNIATQEEAIKMGEEWYTERALAIVAQVEKSKVDEIQEVAIEPEVIIPEVISA